MANRLQIQEDESVILRITHSNIKSFSTDLRFSTQMTVEAVKEKLWKKCGTSVDSMCLELYDDTGAKVSDLADNTRPLGFYSPQDGFRVHVIDLDPSSVTSGGWLEDTSLVEKYKISDEAFGKLDASMEMNEEDINSCQIQEWYPHFKSVSIKTLIHDLPESFIQYLLADSGNFFLPVSIANDDAFPNRFGNPEDEQIWEHDPEAEQDYVRSDDSEDTAEECAPPPSFPDLEMKINASIQTLGGAVFPKLNWSSPKDAAWISSIGNLKCTSFSEIALLLRSSDSVIHDLWHPYDSCADKSRSRPPVFYLALRKWYPSFQPDMEFRCFVKFKCLVGICQREMTNFYPSLLERRGDLGVMVEDFFRGSVKGRFGSESYTCDVYVTKDGRVKLLDFNPWGGSTLPLMFSWEELEEKSGGDDESEFRVVESQCGIRPGLKTAVPYDYLDTSSGSGWDEFFRMAEKESREHCEA